MTVPGPRRIAGTKGKTRWQCEQRGVGRLGSGQQGILDADVVEVLGAAHRQAHPQHRPDRRRRDRASRVEALARDRDAARQRPHAVDAGIVGQPQRVIQAPYAVGARDADQGAVAAGRAEPGAERGAEHARRGQRRRAHGRPPPYNVAQDRRVGRASSQLARAPQLICESPQGHGVIDRRLPPLSLVRAHPPVRGRGDQRAGRIGLEQRLARIAKGSGTTMQEINALFNQFKQMQKMMKQRSAGRMPKMFAGLGR